MHFEGKIECQKRMDALVTLDFSILREFILAIYLDPFSLIYCHTTRSGGLQRRNRYNFFDMLEAPMHSRMAFTILFVTTVRVVILDKTLSV